MKSLLKNEHELRWKMENPVLKRASAEGSWPNSPRLGSSHSIPDLLHELPRLQHLPTRGVPIFVRNQSERDRKKIVRRICQLMNLTSPTALAKSSTTELLHNL